MPPTTPQEYGKISVTCNIDSARIYIDDINTGKITPAIILVSIGNHLIGLEKDNYVSETKNITVEKDSTIDVSFTLKLALADKIVLIEDFANVSCTPCVTSNKILESLKQSFGSKQILIIKYPTNFPSPSDPFYLANITDCNARMSFYNILVAPTTRVDGNLNPVSTDSISVKEEINDRIIQLPKFKITVSDSFGIGNYNIWIRLETIDTTGINFSDLVLQTVVIESMVEFSTPPGSNGETKFYDVMRKMLPSTEGEALIYSASGTQYLNRQVTINQAWNSSKLETIAFIQNKITKEVLQAGGTVMYN
jgi:hypothetical protein